MNIIGDISGILKAEGVNAENIRKLHHNRYQP